MFLDRDGVINQNRADYVKRWEEFRFLPSAIPALRALAASPFLVVVLTNQSAVGRGLMTMEAVEEINRRMCGEVAAAGGRIDAVYCCPHLSEDGCSCRKPLPGLFLQAANDWGIELDASYCIGDKVSDMEAGRSAGCRGILVLTGEGVSQAEQLLGLYPVVPDLLHAVELVLSTEMSNLP